METARSTRRRLYADVLVVVASVYLFILGAYSPPFAAPQAAGPGEAAMGWLWGGTALGGALGLAAFFLSLKWPRAAKGVLALAGLVVLATLFSVREWTWYTFAGVVLPGLVLLGCVPFLGPMPTPEEEGKPR